MKNTTILTLAAMLLGTAGAIAQSAYTKPAGFVTHTLKSGQFNLIGLTLHQPILVAGELDDVNGTTLGDDEVNFGTELTAGKTYVLEITDASDADLIGTIQEVTVWSGNTITTPQDLGAQGLVSGDKYQIRTASTISDIFGDTNSAGLQDGTSFAASDTVYVPNSNGGFDVIYYSSGGFVGVGWRKVGGGTADQSGAVIFTTDGFYVYRRAAQDLALVVTGAVKVLDTELAITSKFAYVSGAYPVGSTLGSSGLENTLTNGTAAVASDAVLIQNPTGTFSTFYYSTGGFVGIGWRKVGGGSADQSGVELPSAFIIRRTGDTDFNAKLTKPASYDNL